MAELTLVVVAAALVNNVVLIQSLGVWPLLESTGHMDTAIATALMTGAVMIVTAVLTHAVDRSVLLPFDVAYLRLIAFVVTVVLAARGADALARRFSPAFARVAGVSADLVTASSVVLGVVVLNSVAGRSVLAALLYAVGAALGFGLALVLFAGLRQRLTRTDIPGPFRGPAIAFATAGILSLAFLGFAGFARL